MVDPPATDQRLVVKLVLEDGHQVAEESVDTSGRASVSRLVAKEAQLWSPWSWANPLGVMEASCSLNLEVRVVFNCTPPREPVYHQLPANARAVDVLETCVGWDDVRNWCIGLPGRDHFAPTDHVFFFKTKVSILSCRDLTHPDDCGPPLRR